MKNEFLFLTSLLKTNNEKGIRSSFAILKTKKEFLFLFSFFVRKFENEKGKDGISTDHLTLTRGPFCWQRNFGSPGTTACARRRVRWTCLSPASRFRPWVSTSRASVAPPRWRWTNYRVVWWRPGKSHLGQYLQRESGCVGFGFTLTFLAAE